MSIQMLRCMRHEANAHVFTNTHAPGVEQSVGPVDHGLTVKRTSRFVLASGIETVASSLVEVRVILVVTVETPPWMVRPKAVVDERQLLTVRC